MTQLLEVVLEVTKGIAAGGGGRASSTKAGAGDRQQGLDAQQHAMLVS
jgi:hypothetical protein